jgi:serine protease
LALLAFATAALLAPAAGAAASGDPADGLNASGGHEFVPGEVVVRFRDEAKSHQYRLPDDVGVHEAARALRRNPRVSYAVPNYIAHAAGPFVPNDPGIAHETGGWAQTQWNFLRASRGGVNAQRAWARLAKSAQRVGGRGTEIAVVDTGVAYTNASRYAISPDFLPTQFAPGYDFVDHDAVPLDENGHGTHVAGTIGERVNNGAGLTGLAYGATLLPVRVLDRTGKGSANTVAAGIRWAADRAQVINLSLEFGTAVTNCDNVPQVCDAIEYANSRRALVVAAAGNTGDARVASPGGLPHVLSVGATTDDQCLGDYSNFGQGLDLVAPGGGNSAPIDDPGCKSAQSGREICQLGFDRPKFQTFFLKCLHGTSQATPHVSAAAALVRASQVVGKNPNPGKVARRIERTARRIGAHRYYGAGLLDVGSATKKRKKGR